MHGHRHIDWIGALRRLRIVSAPSPVMEATDDEPTCFYIHTLAAGRRGRLALLEPQRVEIAGTVRHLTRVSSRLRAFVRARRAVPQASGSTDAGRRRSARRW